MTAQGRDQDSDSRVEFSRRGAPSQPGCGENADCGWSSGDYFGRGGDPFRSLAPFPGERRRGVECKRELQRWLQSDSFDVADAGVHRRRPYRHFQLDRLAADAASCPNCHAARRWPGPRRGRQRRRLDPARFCVGV